MKSYFIFLSRNKLYASIEMLGLSVAFGFIILLASYARTEFNVGTKQALSQQLYDVGTGSILGMTLGTAEDFFPSVPEIKSWTRIANYEEMEDVMVNGDYYKVKGAAIDSNFLQLFDYRLTGCSKDRILSTTDLMIISESFARKAFPDEDAVGRTISYNGKNYTVAGIIQDFEPCDIFDYRDIFLSMKAIEDMQHGDVFGSVNTFVTLADGANPDSVASKLLDKYCAHWEFYARDASTNASIFGSSLTRLDKMYFSNKEHNDFIRAGNEKQVEILMIVALVFLVSAVFNYINLTVAYAGRRAKEMATRRLLGESRFGTICRYICESFIFTSACFALGWVLAACFRPTMNNLLETDIPMYADWLSVICCVALLCIISLISGILPAMIVSRLKPIDVVKGNFRLRSKMTFSKAFIVCQNVISTVLIAVAFTMTLQMNHLVNLPTGYNTDNLILLDTWALVDDAEALNELARQLKSIPQIENVGKYSNLPHNYQSLGFCVHDEKVTWLAVSPLDSTCFKLLGFKILEKYSEPLDSTYWFTVDAKRRYGITEKNRTVGQREDGKPLYECCGIIADYRSGDALAEPLEDSHDVVANCNMSSGGMIIKYSGNQKETFAAVAKTWRKIAKEYLGIPREADIKSLKEELDSSLTGKRNTMMLVNIFMMLSILISALGLFAMSVYYSNLQKKAIALHKVFGADCRQAALRLSRPFIISSLIAIVIATPISVKLMDYYLEDFYYRIAFPWWVPVVSAVISLGASVVCILGQAIKTASSNPVKAIITE